MSKTHLYLLRKKMICIADGSRKNNVCGWWLGEVEEQANNYLQKRGFDKGALPQNYMSVAPKSVEAVSGGRIGYISRNLEFILSPLGRKQFGSDFGHYRQRRTQRFCRKNYKKNLC